MTAVWVSQEFEQIQFNSIIEIEPTIVEQSVRVVSVCVRDFLEILPSLLFCEENCRKAYLPQRLYERGSHCAL
jgi:hypothetical protein